MIRAFMGGTFDPVHYGHLRIADRVRRALALPELALLPTAIPPHKSASALTPVAHRVEMLRLALGEFPGLVLCELELRDRVAYTIDTLRLLRDGPPGCRPVFVVGMDSIHQLHTWKDYRELLDEFDLVAVARPDHVSPGEPAPYVLERLRPAVAPGATGIVLEHEEEELGRGGRIFPLTLPAESISSREIRRRVAAGAGLRELVPLDVALYIRRHGLYREGALPLKTDTPDDVLLCVDAARDRKAEEIVALDLRGLSDVTDTFVICHGSSDRQVVAIAENIEMRLRKECGRKPAHIEGLRRGEWVLMDYIDFVVHVFLEEKRAFYRLDRLWGDAPSLPLPDAGDVAGAAENA
jgi:nicotinate (nicotinamide) nucleotide adenylyltransferase/ribosome silencing factor RsfS/YbeB/iojap